MKWVDSIIYLFISLNNCVQLVGITMRDEKMGAKLHRRTYQRASTCRIYTSGGKPSRLFFLYSPVTHF